MEIISRIHALKDDGIGRIRKSSTFQSIRNSFNLSEKDAIALAIIRQLSDSLPTDSCNMTQEQAEDIIKKRFGFRPGYQRRYGGYNIMDGEWLGI